MLIFFLVISLTLLAVLSGLYIRLNYLFKDLDRRYNETYEIMRVYVNNNDMLKLTHEQALKDKETETLKRISEATKKSLNTSRSVIKGKVSEELFPLFEDFPFITSDIKFMGMPTDLIIFKGLSEVRDGPTEPDIEILFADIKTGKSQLSKVQRRIRDAVIAGRVGWATIEIKDNKVNVKYASKPKGDINVTTT